MPKAAAAAVGVAVEAAAARLAAQAAHLARAQPSAPLLPDPLEQDPRAQAESQSGQATSAALIMQGTIRAALVRQREAGIPPPREQTHWALLIPAAPALQPETQVFGQAPPDEALEREAALR